MTHISRKVLRALGATLLLGLLSCSDKGPASRSGRTQDDRSVGQEQASSPQRGSAEAALAEHPPAVLQASWSRSHTGCLELLLSNRGTHKTRLAKAMSLDPGSQRTARPLAVDERLVQGGCVTLMPGAQLRFALCDLEEAFDSARVETSRCGQPGG